MLAIFDIDGTLRTVADPWIHLHRHLGTAERGEDFFRRWSSGEISYQQLSALDASLWKGVRRSRMREALASNPLRAGAKQLVNWFRLREIPCVGISTGLCVFNEVAKRELGLDEIITNELVFSGDICTGAVTVNVEEDSKGAILAMICQRYGCEPSSTIVFGDGPADRAMFAMARFSVAVFPRSPELAAEASLVVATEPIDRACEPLLARLM
jgi:phosphoserine phosphatase